MNSTCRYLALIILAVLFGASAYAGKESGGGIILSAEFATTGRQAIEILSQGDPGMNLQTILTAVKDTKVIPVDSICYKDPVLQKPYCEDAHFDQTNNVILFSYLHWDDFECNSKIVLAAHEFLRASGVETEDYSYSGRFITRKFATCEGQGGSDSQQLACANLVVNLDRSFDKLCGRVLALQEARDATKH